MKSQKNRIELVTRPGQGGGSGGKFGALSDMINVRGRTGSGSARVCVDGGVQISSGENMFIRPTNAKMSSHCLPCSG